MNAIIWEMIPIPSGILYIMCRAYETIYGYIACVMMIKIAKIVQ